MYNLVIDKSLALSIKNGIIYLMSTITHILNVMPFLALIKQVCYVIKFDIVN